MSMRPRLVEEGTPIFPVGTSTKDRDNDYQSHQNTNELYEEFNWASKSGIDPQHQQRQRGHPTLSTPQSSSVSSSSSLRIASRSKKPTILQFEIQNKRRNRNDGCKFANIDNMDLSYPNTIQQLHSNGNSAMETDEDAPHDISINQNKRSSLVSIRDLSQLSGSRHTLSTSFVIGRPVNESQLENTDITRMEVDDILPKPPLIVVDGANLAYAYANAMGLRNQSGCVEPDVQGIHICASYFANVGCRIQVVLPIHWMRKKPRADDHVQNENARMITPQVDILQNLEDHNILCCSPPADDDDAYVIAMARREDGRARRKNLHYTSASLLDNNISSAGGAFVLSNDFFRDATARDSTGELKHWLDGKYHSDNGHLPPYPPGRISYSFCNLGSMNEYGDPQLDFMPNPRHILIETIEKINRSK